MERGELKRPGFSKFNMVYVEVFWQVRIFFVPEENEAACHHLLTLPSLKNISHSIVNQPLH
jgi:transcription initiation factor IIF auxiliary subunit